MTATVRKEISKDDYKFFIGRVEKISNGQVAFIADTQKKAVELLGEKIPQNVIDAANNYKAFNIWLGNMVNPIIVSDSGYKEEIRVFGDGYDFFEVKAETKPDKNNPKTGGNAAAVNVDLSNATSVENAGNQICVALQNSSLSDGDYALVKMAHKMISALAEEDELAKKCAAIDSVCAEVYAVEAYTSANFMTITLKDMRELMCVKDLMILAKVNENDYRTSWGKGLIRGFSFNRNAVAKAVIYTLNLAGIKADGRTDYTMVDEVSTENDATNVEIENAVKRENDMPSVEKIFAAVTTEIKPHIRGKYFVQIDDNWYQQSVRESFKTLEDAVKIARIMHSELRKVSRHIEATVDARTVDISKYCFRADDWTTFFEIDNYGNEKVLRRETIDAIAKIDNRTVEEVRNDIGRCTDNYGIYKNSAAAVEKLITEVDAVNAEIAAKLEAEEINAIDDYIVDVDAAAEVEKINAEIAEIENAVTVLTVRESEIKAALSKYNAIGEHFDDIMDVAVDEGLPNWEREQKKLIRKHYAAECKEKAKFLRDFFAEIGLPKKVLKVSVKYDYSDILGTVDYTIEISPKTEKIDADQLEKIAEYFESRDTEVEVDGFDFYEFDDVLDEEDAEIEINILSETTPDDTAAIETENVPATVEEVKAEKNSLKAKVAEILNRPRKSVIDWKATFEDMKISEILNLQKDLKKFLKLGQIDLAENIFSMLKTLCKNYREQFAA